MSLIDCVRLCIRDQFRNTHGVIFSLHVSLIVDKCKNVLFRKFKHTNIPTNVNVILLICLTRF